jgi:spermidine synthase
MNELTGDAAIASPTARRRLPVLVVLFVCSGCAALVYEIVWFQLLELVIGSSTVSLGILLGTFMAGMCLGSVAMPLLVSRRHHPLRVYALMELVIGLMGLMLFFGLPFVGGIYTAWAEPGTPGMALRATVAGVCLLPPTILMGATLPVISRWVETTPQGVSWLGLFYGGNIAGAVVGSLLAGFYLLRLYDVATATYVAAALNIGVALLSMVIAKAVPYVASEPPESKFTDQPVPGAWAVYVSIALSGMTALAAEVIWTRLLSLMFGATVYAFALILAVFLLGLGIGATFGAVLGGRMERPRAALGWCQILLCGAMAWAAYQLAQSLPYWQINSAEAANPWFRMRLDLSRCLWAVLPPAIFWGASFPLALAAVASRRQDPGAWVGRVYGANTVGTIVGSLAASLWLVAWIGSRHAQQGLIAVSAISGLLVLAPLAGARSPSKATFSVAVLLAAVGGGMLVWSVPEIPPEFIAYGRRVTESGHARVIYAAEGLTTAIAVSRSSDEVLNYHSAGKIQASSEWQDMRLQRMLGHLTTLVPSNPRSFLVIGLGAGVTAGAVSIEPKLDRVTIVEIEPLVPKVVSQYFREYNFDVLAQPKVHLRIDDGRHFLLTTKETFDGITSDPFDPWVKGTAALYTKEFFELARRRLNPGGVVTQFVQLYESNEEAVKSQIATFFEVFPNGRVFANTVMGQGYDLVLLGQAEPGPIDVDRIEELLHTAEHARVAQSLQEIGFYSGVDLLSTYVGQASDLRPWLKDAVINRDRNLRLQYLAGMGLNLHHEGEIFDHMTAFGPRLSPNVFSGSEALLEYLGRAIESGSSRY